MDADVPEPTYLTTPAGRIAWWVARGGDLPPAVMVHGGPGDGCNPLKGPMMDLGRDVFQYDQMGCGMSDPVEHPDLWTAEDYADELHGFLKMVVKRKAVLIGASWGAGLIVKYIEKYGTDRVTGLVLPSPFLSTEDWLRDMGENFKDMSELHYLRLMEHRSGSGNYDIGDIMRDYRGIYLFSKKENAPIAEQAEEGNPIYRGMWGDDETYCTGTLKDFDVTDTLPRIDVPVLYMCGDSDELRVETMLDYARSTPGQRYAVVPCAGHALSFEQFELYRGCIAAFLAEYGLRPKKPCAYYMINTDQSLKTVSPGALSRIHGIYRTSFGNTEVNTIIYYRYIL